MTKWKAIEYSLYGYTAKLFWSGRCIGNGPVEDYSYVGRGLLRINSNNNMMSNKRKVSVGEAYSSFSTSDVNEDGADCPFYREFIKEHFFQSAHITNGVVR